MMCFGPAAPSTVRIRARLQARGPAAAVVLSDEQVAAMAGDARAPAVTVRVNGQTFAGRIGRMGGEALLGFNRAVREQTGVAVGDELELEIALDSEPRAVEVPEDLAERLADDDAARAAFDAIAYTHRKAFARWVADARRPDTRRRRIAETLTMLREGRTLR